MKGSTPVTLMLTVITLAAGCIQQTPDSSQNKTALLSFTEYFCEWTEWSSPFAYTQFAYQENGEIKYVRTKTTCKDFESKNVSPLITTRLPIFGEKIELFYSGDSPVAIKRENGDQYQIETTSGSIRSFFRASINPYENLKYLQNSHPELVIQECRLLKNAHEHDTCISYQAAFQKNISICEELLLSENRNSCKTWVDNIISGNVND